MEVVRLLRHVLCIYWIFTGASSASEECVYNCEKDVQYVTILGTPMQGSSSIMISAGLTDHCHIYVDTFQQHVLDVANVSDVRETTGVFMISFTCDRAIDISFIGRNGGYKHKINAFFRFNKMCSFHPQIFQTLDSAFSIVYLSDGSGSLIKSAMHNCTWSRDLIFLEIAGSSVHSPGSIDNFVNCVPVFSSVLSLCLVSLIKKELPDVIREKFPRLQQLWLLDNTLDTAPPFPWATELVYPGVIRRLDNASETDTTHYVQRMLVLNNNQITHLENYRFRPTIEFLRLKGNGLQAISNATFHNLSILQELDLSDNKLKIIPEGTFSSLVSVTKLSLANNGLYKLAGNTFANMEKLRHLNLADNQLKRIPDILLNGLHNLIALHMEHNLIYTLPETLFKPPLKLAYLNNNPLEYIPLTLFYTSSLQYVDLSKTNVSEIHIKRLIKNLSRTRVKSTFAEFALDGVQTDIQVIIDLSDCDIEYIPVDIKSRYECLQLIMLLSYFKLKLDNNPIDCACHSENIWVLLKAAFKSDRLGYIKNEWMCRFPPSFNSRKIMSLSRSEMYCPANVFNCPSQCTCSKRLESDGIIVNCEDSNVTTLPDTLPSAPQVELLYHAAKLTNITYRPYFINVTSMELFSNEISYIAPEVFYHMPKLRKLYLYNNLLTHLPTSIQSLTLNVSALADNPYECDCTMKWMKYWLLNQTYPIVYNSNNSVTIPVFSDWNQVTCADGKRMVTFPDNDFVCKTPVEFDTVTHIVLPSVGSGSGFLCLVILVLLGYAYRNELKVVMFVYTGLHPFDKEDDRRDYLVDAVVLHSSTDTDWAIESVVDVLEEADYTVADVSRDFLVGLSYQENLRRFMNTSKRVIMCVSETLKVDHEWFDIAWDFASFKIKNSKSNFVILLNKQLPKRYLTDKDLKTYARSRMYINYTSPLFASKLIYSMPRLGAKTFDGEMEHRRNVIADIFKCESSPTDEEATYHRVPAFLAYADDDTAYVRRQLAAVLEDEDQIPLYIRDRDFPLGGSMAENITHAVDKCHHTILLVPELGMIDEWHMYAFIQARDKSYSHQATCNHLIVILRGAVNMENLPDDLRQYIDSVITLSTEDAWFRKRLRDALNATSVRDHGTCNVEENDDYSQNASENTLLLC